MTPSGRTWVAIAILARPLAAQVPDAVVTLVPEVVTLRPGDTFRIAARIRLPGGWHINWTNPGQAGLPTTVEWRVPPHVIVAGVAWPYPERAETAGAVAHVYLKEVVTFTSFRLTPAAPRGPITLAATFHWGMCREVCVPQQVSTSLTLGVGTVAPEPSPRWDGTVRAALALLPDRPSELESRAIRRGSTVVLTVRRRDGTPLSAGRVTFFPETRPFPAAILVPRERRGALEFAIVGSPITDRLSGVLVNDAGWTAGLRALQLDLRVGRP